MSMSADKVVRKDLSQYSYEMSERQRRTQSAGAASSSLRSQINKEPKNNSLNKDTNRDVTAVSKLVSRKLELYLSDVRREEGFDPTGGRGVASVAGHLYYADTSARTNSGESEQAKKSNRTPREDAERIRQVANSLLDTRAHSSMDVIQQVRPFSASCMPLNVQNFRIHFGTVLNIDKYLEYYRQQGLAGGASERNRRIKQQSKLRQTIKNETSRGEKSSKVNSDQDACRTCEVYSLTTPRYLESSWDIAASVRHQMRSFSVDEIRKLRRRSDESYPVRVFVDDDEPEMHSPKCDGHSQAVHESSIGLRQSHDSEVSADNHVVNHDDDDVYKTHAACNYDDMEEFCS